MGKTAIAAKKLDHRDQLRVNRDRGRDRGGSDRGPENRDRGHDAGAFARVKFW